MKRFCTVMLMLICLMVFVGCEKKDPPNESYSIIINSVDNIEIQCEYSEAKQGQLIDLTYNLDLGYELKYFTVNGIKIDGSVFEMPNKAVIVSAVVEREKIIYTYNIYYNGGFDSNPNPSTYNTESGEIILQNPTKAGYDFKGWYKDSMFKGEKVTKIEDGETGDIRLFAKFVCNETSNGYRLIKSVIDFMEIIPTDLDGKYYIDGVIDFEGYDYTPIGTKENPFNGTLERLKGSIINLNLNANSDYNGLFGYMSGATIKNIIVEDFEISNETSQSKIQYIGVLAGYATDCNIDDVNIKHSKIDVHVSDGYLGTFVGATKQTTFTDCEAYSCNLCAINEKDLFAGGICGDAINTTISKCIVTLLNNIGISASVDDCNIYYGGFVGRMNKSNISNSYVLQKGTNISVNMYVKKGAAFVGGLVGKSENQSQIAKAYTSINSIICRESSDEQKQLNLYISSIVAYLDSTSTISKSYVTTYSDSIDSTATTFSCSQGIGLIVAYTENEANVSECYVTSSFKVSNDLNLLFNDLYTIDLESNIKTLIGWIDF